MPLFTVPKASFLGESVGVFKGANVIGPGRLFGSIQVLSDSLQIITIIFGKLCFSQKIYSKIHQ